VEGYGGAEPLDDSPAVPELAFPEECPADPVYPASVFVTAIAAFFSLSDIDLCVLRLKYQRLSHDQVAERMGITPRAVEGRFSRILARYPVLVTLFPCRRVGG
jgi:DNA-directed RNA polymerase specialized sigma24 family protein